jgi:hypothetical protein
VNKRLLLQVVMTVLVVIALVLGVSAEGIEPIP